MTTVIMRRAFNSDNSTSKINYFRYLKNGTNISKVIETATLELIGSVSRSSLKLTMI